MTGAHFKNERQSKSFFLSCKRISNNNIGAGGERWEFTVRNVLRQYREDFIHESQKYRLSNPLFDPYQQNGLAALYQASELLRSPMKRVRKATCKYTFKNLFLVAF